MDGESLRVRRRFGNIQIFFSGQITDLGRCRAGGCRAAVAAVGAAAGGGELRHRM